MARVKRSEKRQSEHHIRISPMSLDDSSGKLASNEEVESRWDVLRSDLLDTHMRMRVHAAISLLPDAYRSLSESMFIHGLSYTETAEFNSTTRGATVGRISDAKERLAFLLKNTQVLASRDDLLVKIRAHTSSTDFVFVHDFLSHLDYKKALQQMKNDRLTLLYHESLLNNILPKALRRSGYILHANTFEFLVANSEQLKDTTRV